MMCIKKIAAVCLAAAMMLGMLAVPGAAVGDPFAGKTSVNVVYLGGSITQGGSASDSRHSWAGIVSDYLTQTYTGKNFNFYNKGIGGTGSDFGLARLERDVLYCNPDMVFIEFAVNDIGKPAASVNEWIESIILTLRQAPSNPYIMFVFTLQSNGSSIFNNSAPQKVVADYYGLPCVDILGEVNKMPNPLGYATSILKDHAHPDDAGYAYYASLIVNALSQGQFQRPSARTDKFSSASKVLHTDFIAASSATKSAGWSQSGRILQTNIANATISYTFTGRVFGLTSYILTEGGTYKITLDGNDLLTADCFFADVNQPALAYCNFNLENTTHTVVITSLGASLTGGNGSTVKIEDIIVEKQADEPISTDFSLDEQFDIVEDGASQGYSLINWRYRDNKWQTPPCTANGELVLVFGGERNAAMQSISRKFDTIFDVENTANVVLEMKFKIGDAVPLMEAFPTLVGGAYEGKIVAEGNGYVYKVRTRDGFKTIGGIEAQQTYTLSVVFNFAEKTRQVTLKNEDTGAQNVYGGLEYQNDVTKLQKLNFFGYRANGGNAGTLYIDYVTLGK